MCRLEVFGDWYRGCGHFVKAYDLGNITDCGSPTCGISAAHIHKAPNCRCNKTPQDERRIINMFQTPCEACRSAEFARLTGR